MIFSDDDGFVAYLVINAVGILYERVLNPKLRIFSDHGNPCQTAHIQSSHRDFNALVIHVTLTNIDEPATVAHH